MSRREKRANPPWCWICGGKLAMGGWQYVDYRGDDGHIHPVHGQCMLDAQRHGTDRHGCVHCAGRGCEYCCPAKDVVYR